MTIRIILALALIGTAVWCFTQQRKLNRPTLHTSSDDLRLAEAMNVNLHSSIHSE